MSKGHVVLFHGHHGLFHRSYHWVPTNLLFLCSLVRDDGFDVTILDENDHDYDPSRVDALIKDALVCGVSTTTGQQILRGVEFSKRVRALRPDCKIIWGGPHVSALPEQALAEGYVDMVCTGRGEVTLRELARAVHDGREIEQVPGIHYKANGCVRVNAPASAPKFKDLPPLPYGALHVDGYLNPATRVLNYQTAIGCVGRCSFCFWYGKHTVERNGLDQVFADLERLLHAHDLTSIYFDDPDFFQGPQFVKQFLNRLEQSELRFHWGACSRADVLSRYPRETFLQAARLGLHRIFVGLESGSPRMLDKMSKSISLEDVVRLVETTRDIDIELYMGLIFGAPGETPEDLVITGEFIRKLKSIKPHIAYQMTTFTPYPGLPLTQELAESGYAFPTTLEGWGALERRPDASLIPAWIQDRDRYAATLREYFSDASPVTYRPAHHKLRPAPALRAAAG